MGLLDRTRVGLAAGARWFAARITNDPRSPEGDRVYYSGRTGAGVVITPDTALTVSACWAAHRYLSQTVAVLSWRAMRDTDKGPEIAATHPVDYLLNVRPSAEWSAMQFRETITGWAIRRGNGYAEIERDTRGQPFALWPIHPERVQVCRDPETHKLFYRVTNSVGGVTTVDAGDMLHIRGYGEGPVGLSVMAYAAESIGAAKAAQLFGASYFGNSATPAFVVTMKKPTTPAGLAAIEKKLHERMGGPRRANRTVAIDNDSTIAPIQNDAEKSQLVQAQQFYIEEICRWFGVPPHKVQHLLRATFSNIEHQSIEVVVDSILPWAKRWEQEADYKLFGERNRRGFYSHIDLDGLMRGDSTARGAFYTSMRNIGAINANEIRAREKMPSLGAPGEKYIVQSGFVTLEQLGTIPVATAPGAPADNQGDNAPADTPAENDARARVYEKLGLALPLKLEVIEQ